MAQQKTPVLYTENDEIELPWRWEICPTCDGRGSHSLRFGAIPMDEFMSEWDEDERDDYMNGRYDEPCGCDHGKVKVADRSKMTDEQRKAYDAQLRDDEEYERMCEAERRMGA